MARIIFISCVSKKLTTKALAKELYISPLFKFNLAFARSLKPKKIYILSAKYGLVDLETKIAPYEETLNTKSVAKIKIWADKVTKQMVGKIDFAKDEAIFLAGAKYRRFLLPLFKHSSVPLAGLGIGQQLQYLKKKTAYANQLRRLT